MWFRACLVVCLISFACAPKAGPARTGEPTAGEPTTGERRRERGADDQVDRRATPDCPRRFAASMQDSACEPSRACSYPQAECHCVPRFPCTGVDPGPDVQVSYAWSCVVTDETVLRADGCPAAVPSAGGKCATSWQVCHYSPHCGGLQSTARCVDREWQLEQRDIAPPPSIDPG